MKLKYKKVKKLVAHCGECDEELQGNNSISFPYKCSCGEWESQWLKNKSNEFELKK